jgi:hypothetical protein
MTDIARRKPQVGARSSTLWHVVPVAGRLSLETGKRPPFAGIGHYPFVGRSHEDDPHYRDTGGWTGTSWGIWLPGALAGVGSLFGMAGGPMWCPGMRRPYGEFQR